MPVRWDSAKDQWLLVQLIDHMNVSQADLKRLAAAWPAALGKAPTPRAISEHFVKLRSQVGNSGAKTFKSKTATATATKATVTTKSATTCRPTKRARTSVKSEPRSDSEDEAETTHDEEAAMHPKIKKENGVQNDDGGTGEGGEDGDQTPARKSLPRLTKSPENMRKMQEVIRTQFGESSEDSDVAGGDEGVYKPEPEE
ncbi:hypothetical protein CAC42_710 [Sphaceloma murrayae]|uniref:Uncharacterized protein n=1 Tax=Sphaceloma murrayae TaxID=2082308 RepID=A0A2K1QKH7_9PEZI|nr:hypothetical protein CAC42_710 [Sphaceloma murrayae]